MRAKNLVQLCAAFALAATGAVVSAQQAPLLPSAPQKQFGASIAPVYEGWWDNADGTKTVLFGYYSRNTKEEVDVPLGPNNHFEPGELDRGQPTHFLTSRQFGMFTITLPKDVGTQKLIWVLNHAGYNATAHVNLAPDFVLSAAKSVEESPDRSFNLPPAFSFEPNGLKFTMPMASTVNIAKRTATAGTPMPLDIYAQDDARYSSGTNAPMRTPPPVVTLVVSKYRGPGTVTINEKRPVVKVLKGGKPFEAFEGQASTTVTFSDPGEYWLHVTANDYSGHGGAGAGCCWTTGLMKVTVGGTSVPRTTGE